MTNPPLPPACVWCSHSWLHRFLFVSFCLSHSSSSSSSSHPLSVSISTSSFTIPFFSSSPPPPPLSSPTTTTPFYSLPFPFPSSSFHSFIVLSVHHFTPFLVPTPRLLVIRRGRPLLTSPPHFLIHSL